MLPLIQVCAVPDEGICPIIKRLRMKEFHSEEALRTQEENEVSISNIEVELNGRD